MEKTTPKRKRTPPPDVFDYWQDNRGDWWWDFRAAGNSEIIAGSTEGVKSESHCLAMIGRIRSGSPQAKIRKVPAK